MSDTEKAAGVLKIRDKSVWREEDAEFSKGYQSKKYDLSQLHHQNFRFGKNVSTIVFKHDNFYFKVLFIKGVSMKNRENRSL